MYSIYCHTPGTCLKLPNPFNIPFNTKCTYYTQTINDSWEVTLHWWVSGFGCFETSGITHPATQLHVPESLNPQQHLARRTVPCLIMGNKSTIDCQDKHCALSPRCSASYNKLYRIPRSYIWDLFRVSAVNLRPRNIQLRCCLLQTQVDSFQLITQSRAPRLLFVSSNNRATISTFTFRL
jgi:hypothetical protein